MTAAKKILAGLRDAVSGNLDRVRIDGQTWVRVPDCPGCAAVSGGHPPITRHYHHPLCTADMGRCSACGAEIDRKSWSRQVGEVCLRCAVGDE